MRIVAAFLGTVVCVSTVGAQTLERFAFEHGAMGTEFRIVLYAADAHHAERAASAAFRRIDEVDGALSDYKPTSEILRLSKTAGSRRWVPVGDDLWAVLVRSEGLSVETDGAFDITVGPLVRLWRWANRRGVLPDAERIAHARGAVGYNLIELDRPTQRVRLPVPGMQLDAGAIGKGYAADAAIAELDSAGIRSALVDAGGDIVVSGAPPGAAGWRVAIPAAQAENVTESNVWLTHGAVATSGDKYRYLVVDGVRFSHILDPKTGLGVTVQRIATVIASSGAEADALASAISVLGPRRGIALLTERPDVSGRILEQDGMTWREWTTECRDSSQSQAGLCSATFERATDQHQN